VVNCGGVTGLANASPTATPPLTRAMCRLPPLEHGVATTSPAAAAVASAVRYCAHQQPISLCVSCTPAGTIIRSCIPAWSSCWHGTLTLLPHGWFLSQPGYVKAARTHKQSERKLNSTTIFLSKPSNYDFWDGWVRHLSTSDSSFAQCSNEK